MCTHWLIASSHIASYEAIWLEAISRVIFATLSIGNVTFTKTMNPVPTRQQNWRLGHPTGWLKLWLRLARIQSRPTRYNRNLLVSCSRTLVCIYSAAKLVAWTPYRVNHLKLNSAPIQLGPARYNRTMLVSFSRTLVRNKKNYKTQIRI